MVFGNHTVHIRVKVPNLLIASNLRKLGGGSLCGKGAERSGSATIEKWKKSATSVLFKIKPGRRLVDLLLL